MELKEFIKEKGTKKDWLAMWAVFLGFYVAVTIELLLSLGKWQDDLITGLGVFLGLSSYTILLFSMQLQTVKRRVCNRNGICKYNDEEIAELEERIKRLENDKSRRYD